MVNPNQPVGLHTFRMICSFCLIHSQKQKLYCFPVVVILFVNHDLAGILIKIRYSGFISLVLLNALSLPRTTPVQYPVSLCLCKSGEESSDGVEARPQTRPLDGATTGLEGRRVQVVSSPGPGLRAALFVDQGISIAPTPGATTCRLSRAYVHVKNLLCTSHHRRI